MASTQTDLHKYFKVTKKKTHTKNQKLNDSGILESKKKVTISNNCKLKSDQESVIQEFQDINQSISSPTKDISNFNSENWKVVEEVNEVTNQDKDKKSDLVKKLNPSEIKKKLGKCGRLDELRERLIKLNKCEKNLQDFRKKGWKKEEVVLPPSPHKAYTPPKKRLRFDSSCSNELSKTNKTPIKFKAFDSLDIEVPVSPSKTPGKSVTPSKLTASPIVPGADAVPEELHLPHRYQVLKEIFRACDTVVSLLHNRQELVTFSKLKPAVQEMIKKTFSTTHLGQIKSIFPLAYFFSQEKVGKNGGSYELTVKPNFSYKSAQGHIRKLNLDFGEESSQSNMFRKLNSIVLVERRHVFHMALLEILKTHHSKFLQSLDPPITLTGPVRRWHPEFEIEEVAPPAPSPLPQSPEVDAPGTAREMLDKACRVLSSNNRMKEAVETAAAADASKSRASDSLGTKEQTEAKNDVALALRGVSLSLLEKIRAREAAKAERQMTRSSEASQELVMLSRLPEFARVLRSLFVTAKKNALPLETVLLKISASHSNALSTVEVEKHLDLLLASVPGWCTRHNVRSGIYLKIDKNRQLQEITDKLNAVIKEKT